MLNVSDYAEVGAQMSTSASPVGVIFQRTILNDLVVLASLPREKNVFVYLLMGSVKSVMHPEGLTVHKLDAGPALTKTTHTTPSAGNTERPNTFVLNVVTHLQREMAILFVEHA